MAGIFKTRNVVPKKHGTKLDTNQRASLTYKPMVGLFGSWKDEDGKLAHGVMYCIVPHDKEEQYIPSDVLDEAKQYSKTVSIVLYRLEHQDQFHDILKSGTRRFARNMKHPNHKIGITILFRPDSDPTLHNGRTIRRFGMLFAEVVDQTSTDSLSLPNPNLTPPIISTSSSPSSSITITPPSGVTSTTSSTSTSSFFSSSLSIAPL